jgi:hypothetical protein
MGSFGGFYKGDKKKAKKDKQPNANTGGGLSSASVLTMPEIISKKKKDW